MDIIRRKKWRANKALGGGRGWRNGMRDGSGTIVGTEMISPHLHFASLRPSGHASHGSARLE